MIRFDSPEGREYRKMSLSRPALLSVWFAALEEGASDWAGWARTAAMQANPGDVSVLALRALHGLLDGEAAGAHALLAILGSIPGAADTTYARRTFAARAALQRAEASRP